MILLRAASAVLITSLFCACSSAPQPAAGAASAPVTVTATVTDTPPDTHLLVNPIPSSDTLPEIPAEYLLGRVRPESDTTFVAIPAAYTSKTGIYMHREAFAAYEKMFAAAKAGGVKLTIVSALRTFAQQKTIWENKWNGNTLVGGKKLPQSHPEPGARALKILEYSSMPGTSRHHWGTDIDLNALENSWFTTGEGKKVYDWLSAHAHEYGFCQVYSVIGAERPHGYQEEKWHYSYMPVSARYLEVYLRTITYEKLGGFEGSESAKMIGVIEKYVQGISPACR